jgi:hypothetical protein
MKCPKCGKRTTATAALSVCKHCGKRVPRRKKGTTPRLPLLSRLSQNKLLIAWALGILLLIALLMAVIPTKEERKQIGQLDQEIFIERSKEGREIASNAVLGKVMAVHMRANRRGTIAVRSLHTGKEYSFSVGWRTSYHPRRYPAIGEQVKVYYLLDKGLLEATQVKIGP